jgi:hypothetical protein
MRARLDASRLGLRDAVAADGEETATHLQMPALDEVPVMLPHDAAPPMAGGIAHRPGTPHHQNIMMIM